VGADERAPAFRLTELVAAISLATDLGTGQPPEHALQSCRLAIAVARHIGLDGPATTDVHYVALLRFLGCTADAPETARLVGGDGIAFLAAMGPVVMGGPGEAAARLARTVGRGRSPARRAGLVARALGDPRGAARSLTAHCEVGARLAARLGVGDGVVQGLAHAYERWDGKGLPDGLAGDAVPIAVRITVVARDAVLWQRVAGTEAAVEVLARRRGRAYDPAVVDAVRSVGLPAATAGEVWDDVLAGEPEPVRWVGAAGLDRALAAVGDFADLRSTWTRGRSCRVAGLVRTAARGCGLPTDEVTALARAGLVADLGAVGVPAGTWADPGALGPAAREQVRLHPYLAERVLVRCAGLGSVAALAGAHHERLNASGYHRGSGPGQLSRAARLLAAADVWTALTEDRAHRPARDPAAARDEIQAEVGAGRLDPTAVDAVLAAAGQDVDRRADAHPAGLSDREVEVLRLIARGAANRAVAARLSISPKTVGRHVEHIYAKTGVSTRAGAALFAMEHDLLRE
jgi:HD-GYP domain-containing protein (c-di-GMP phosphodiesterase class II)